MPERKRAVQQTSIHLPYFDEEIPVLIAEDGRSYLPIIEICRMLGIRADTHIPRWRTLLLWEGARKLPFRTRSGVLRIVWCLGADSVYFLYGCFDWSLVSPERRVQLRQATRAAVEVSSKAHMQMIDTYHRMRKSLFRFLTASVGWEVALQRRAQQFAPRLEPDARIQFEALISEGCRLIGEAATQARAVLRWQADLPVVDGFTIDGDGRVIDEYPLPLLPLIPEEESARYFATVEMILNWYCTLSAFLDA